MAVITIRFGIAFTYRCNLSCPNCNRYLDKCAWPDSDLDIMDLRIGYRRLREARIEVGKARVTGGEPLLHPDFRRLIRYVSDKWNKNIKGRTPVFSNGTHRVIRGARWRFNIDPGYKAVFEPTCISPHDLGMTPRFGVVRVCPRQYGCGRLFDAYGFSFCVYAGALGRMLGIDPYHRRPVLHGIPEICDHCPFSLGGRRAAKLFEAVKRGDIKQPTPTFERALDRLKGEGPLKLKRFLER